MKKYHDATKEFKKWWEIAKADDKVPMRDVVGEPLLCPETLQN
jgi:hypothetical protein